MGAYIIVKCGGSMLDELTPAFFEKIHQMQLDGYIPVIVHGGGPAIQRNLEKLRINTVFHDGLRITSSEVLEVVEMTLAGSVNQALTRMANHNKLLAIGLCGSDAGLLQAEALDEERYGYVGKVTSVNTQLIKQITDLRIIPVIAPVAIGANDTRYNINADMAAAAVAEALQAKRIIFVTDVPGILHEKQLLRTLTEKQVAELVDNGVIFGGMVPKVKAAITCLTANIQEVMIVDGKQYHAKGNFFAGTVIQKTMEVV